mmetsp:Transcript_29830/g.65216  ORF Transcript_29830/g.65216 Transcript_29830/m.65216 type:complete len:205 (+) Transcript_29830:1534-2148(+)
MSASFSGSALSHARSTFRPAPRMARRSSGGTSASAGTPSPLCACAPSLSQETCTRIRLARRPMPSTSPLRSLVRWRSPAHSTSLPSPLALSLSLSLWLSLSLSVLFFLLFPSQLSSSLFFFLPPVCAFALAFSGSLLLSGSIVAERAPCSSSAFLPSLNERFLRRFGAPVSCEDGRFRSWRGSRCCCTCCCTCTCCCCSCLPSR